MQGVRPQAHPLPRPAPHLWTGAARPGEHGCVQERILEVRHDRPRLRTCPPFRPRGPAGSRHLVGLLTHELERSHAFSPPRQIPQDCQGDNGSNATALSPEPGFPRPEIRPNTAAGPSRIRTGVPCLPDESSGFLPATRVVGRMYRSREACQWEEAIRHGPQSQPPAVLVASNSAGHEALGREEMTVAGGHAARLRQAAGTAVFARRAGPPGREKKASDTLKPPRRHRR